VGAQANNCHGHWSATLQKSSPEANPPEGTTLLRVEPDLLNPDCCCHITTKEDDKELSNTS
jgi:hypothetical protein